MSKRCKKGKSYSYESFFWSEKEYGLKELLDRFDHRIPFLLVITQGYMGRDEWMHGITSDDVFWFYGIANQPRIVVQDNGKYYSIPVSCEDTIIPTRSSGIDGPPMRIKQMMEDGNYRFFRFKTSERRSAYRGADDGDSIQFGCMEIMDTYDERFMVVHTLLAGDSAAKEGIYSQFAILPVYMPIAVALAVGIVRGSERKFYKTLIGFKNFAENCKHKYDKILKDVSEIMVFDEKPSGGDYEYIHFLQFIKSNKEIENISPEGYWQVQDKDVPTHPPQPPLRPSDKPPVRPPKHKSLADTEETSKSQGKSTVTKKLKKIFKPALNKMKGSNKPRVPQQTPSVGKERAPSPPPGCSSYVESDDSHDSFEYEDVTELFGVKPTPLSQRVGPVALGVEVEDVLPKIHQIIMGGVVPPFDPKDSEDDCISTEEEEDPPYIPEPLSERPPLPARDPYKPENISKQNSLSSTIDSPVLPPLPQNKIAQKHPTTARSLQYEDTTQVDHSQRVPVFPLNKESQPIALSQYYEHTEVSNTSLDGSQRQMGVPRPTPRQTPNQRGILATCVLPSSHELLAKKANLRKSIKSQTPSTGPAFKIPSSPQHIAKSPSPSPKSPSANPMLTRPIPEGYPVPGRLVPEGRVPPMSAVRVPPLTPSPQEPKQAVIRPNVRGKPDKERLSQILIEKNIIKSDMTPTERKYTKPKISLSDVTETCDIPIDISNFTVEDISKCLTLLKLSDYVSDFAELEIDGDMLTSFDEALLKEQFGFNGLDSKRLVKFIGGWRPKVK